MNLSLKQQVEELLKLSKLDRTLLCLFDEEGKQTVKYADIVPVLECAQKMAEALCRIKKPGLQYL